MKVSKQDLGKFFIGILMTTVVVMIVFFSLRTVFASNSNKTKKAQESSEFSVDDASSVMKTISYKEANSLVDDKKDQIIYIGCRYCPNCLVLEPVMEKFLNSLENPMDNRERIVKIEADYKCTPKQTDPNYEEYKIMAKNLELTGGVPQIFYLKEGKRVEEFKGKRTVEDLKAFYDKFQK